MADAARPTPPPGKAAEEEARRYLGKKGYRIVATNYRAGGGEIDIIAERDGTLCFAEVKSRTSSDFGLPEAYVDFRKQRRIIRAAKIFSARKPYRDHSIRFDIIAVQGPGGGNDRITHLEDAFEE